MRKEDTNARAQTHGENGSSATGHHFEREEGRWRMIKSVVALTPLAFSKKRMVAFPILAGPEIGKNSHH
jgi:hypothetical protein